MNLRSLDKLRFRKFLRTPRHSIPADGSGERVRSLIASQMLRARKQTGTDTQHQPPDQDVRQCGISEEGSVDRARVQALDGLTIYDAVQCNST